jgi:hypothetical protein
MSFEGMKIILRILLLSYFKPLAVVKKEISISSASYKFACHKLYSPYEKEEGKKRKKFYTFR